MCPNSEEVLFATCQRVVELAVSFGPPGEQDKQDSCRAIVNALFERLCQVIDSDYPMYPVIDLFRRIAHTTKSSGYVWSKNGGSSQLQERRNNSTIVLAACKLYEAACQFRLTRGLEATCQAADQLRGAGGELVLIRRLFKDLATVKPGWSIPTKEGGYLAEGGFQVPERAGGGVVRFRDMIT